MSDNNNQNDNGMITKIWGPHAWFTMHSIAYCYPLNPNKDDKDKYYNFFILIGDVLPCFYCRDSYKEFIKCGVTKLTYDTLANRETLTKWLYLIHEAVNKKLGVNYDVSYEEISNKYNSYRASCNSIQTNKQLADIIKGCDNTLDKKTISYRIENIKDCPVIPYKIAFEFINYAKLRGISDENFNLINEYNEDCRECMELWNKRNTECNEIIKNMKLNGIKIIEDTGKWKGLPTVEELKLILRLCSNISINKLSDILQTLPDKVNTKNKIYKLVK